MTLRLIMLLLAAPVLGACATKGAKPPVQASKSMADSAEQVLFATHSLLTDKGVQRGEMFADTVFVFDDNTRFELRKVRVTFNTATGAKDGVMSADRGRYNIRQQLLEGFGNVVIVTNDGRKLTSPQLRYMQGLNQISTDSAFTLVRPGENLSGTGFEADPQLTHFKVLKGAKGRSTFTLPNQ